MTTQSEHALPLSAWLDLLARELPAGSAQPTAVEQAAILDLARVAAHASERIAAPISAFLVGVALASHAPEDRAVALRTLVEHLENQTGA